MSSLSGGTLICGAVLIRDDTPWWIIARVVRDNSFPLRGEFTTVSVTRDPDKAGMIFHPDCSVSTLLTVACPRRKTRSD